MTNDLTITVRDGDSGVRIVEVTGEIDMLTSPQLREALIGLHDRGVTRMVVDLGGVDFLDSTGLGVLVGVLKRFRAHDGALLLAALHPNVHKVFEVTQLASVFPIFETADAAVMNCTQ